jgi:predicted RNA-binding protein YlxR (DUF448 family)
VETPTRTCLACRRRSAKPSLIRLTAVDGTVQVDPTASLQTRGAYVCAAQGCASEVLHREGAAIARALRTQRSAVDTARLRAQLGDELAARGTSSSSSDEEVAATPSRGVCT